MSTSHGRLSQARDRAQPISEGKQVEVLASDLDELLTHYRSLIIEIGDVRETLAVAVSAERAACATICITAICSISDFHTAEVKEACINLCENLALRILARQEPQG